MPWYSPLFREAGRAVLDAARQELAQTTAGRLSREVEREFRRASAAPDRLGSALKRYSNFGAQDALRELRGTQFGHFARQIERYARAGDGGMKRLLNEFLSELGPAGRLIQALAGTGGKGEIDRLIGILQAFGHEVLPPKGSRWRGSPMMERALAASQEFLEEAGAKVTWPAQGPAGRAPGRLPFGVPAYGESGEPWREMALPMADGPMQRFGVDHPIVTGAMVPATGSSNVHSFGYDIESNYLYVRYLGYVRGAKGPDGRPFRAGPGSLYRYRDVTPEEFLTLLAANSKGEWVWENLRVRGTWSGHQKDYELVGVIGNYVPRKATVRIDDRTGRLQEWFVQRRVRAIGGGWITSVLPSEEAGPLPWGELDRGSPDRGTPDRGLPDRGR